MKQKIWISTGQNREEKNWKNTELTWEKLVDKLKKPVVTKEPISTYLTLDKDKQLAIKDVGGFVGGVIRGGRRLVNSVTYRTLITLDIDECSADFIAEMSIMWGNSMVIHSTHKHTPESPRYRVIMPLDRDVLPDEYEAIARWVAGEVDIEIFDPTTFQPERLMFWPSVSCDAEYEFFVQDGDPVCADDILAKYADWKDTSQWPISKKAAARIKNSLGKQENPLEKPGRVGVFCRAYTVTEAIAQFIPDLYLPTAHSDRYTYAHGSTHAGVIIYDDLFSFSHHSTDPTMGRLCNAFDLVRIHKFGSLDSEAEVGEKMPANKRPSYVKMMEFMSKDSKIKKLEMSEKLKAIEGDFTFSDDADFEWTEKLEVDSKGKPLSTISNVVWILNNDENLKGILAYDDFEKRPIALKDLPWRSIEKSGKYLKDTDDASFRRYIEQVYKISSPTKIKDAIDIVIMDNAFHPIKDYLKGLKWDGKERLETLFIDVLGAEDCVYTREVTRKTIVAGVARIFEPGIKFDYVLTLVGSQGLGKSRLIGQLGGKWFSDTFGRLDNNQAMENIQGVWIMEIGELAGLNKHEVDQIKLYIAKREDRFRVAYGKRVENFPRSCIFIGTTNSDTPLRDSTGGRRFWIVPVSKKFNRLSQDYIDQIWAEACVYYANGEELYLTDEVESIANEIQKEYTEHDERTSAIVRYLDMKVPDNWYKMSTYERRTYVNSHDEDELVFKKGTTVRDRICIPEIWEELFGGSAKDCSTFNVKFIRAVMNSIPGWEKRMVHIQGHGPQRGWVRTQVVVPELEDDLLG